MWKNKNTGKKLFSTHHLEIMKKMAEEFDFLRFKIQKPNDKLRKRIHNRHAK